MELTAGSKYFNFLAYHGTGLIYPRPAEEGRLFAACVSHTMSLALCCASLSSPLSARDKLQLQQQVESEVDARRARWSRPLQTDLASHTTNNVQYIEVHATAWNRHVHASRSCVSGNRYSTTFFVVLRSNSMIALLVRVKRNYFEVWRFCPQKKTEAEVACHFFRASLSRYDEYSHQTPDIRLLLMSDYCYYYEL